MDQAPKTFAIPVDQKSAEKLEMAEQHARIMAKLEYILRMHQVDVSHYLTDAQPQNVVTNSDILNMLAGELKDTTGKLYFMQYHRDKMIALHDYLKTHPQSVQRKQLYEHYKLLKTYLVDLYRYFYTFDNGKVVYTNRHDFQLPSLDDKPDLEANMRYISRKTHMQNVSEREELCLIILPSGKTYNAPFDHLTLAYWLNLNNISIKNALRFEASKPLYDFNLSSLYNYKFSESSDQDELIALTYEQAQLIGTLYATLSNGWRFMKPLEYELKKSSGLGLGKNETFDEKGVSMHNLRRINLYAGKYFNMKDFVTEMRRGNSVHNPMT
ncbi:MAG: hypothetical protein J6C90_01000 [Clostridia bacterium]|nr:hypothetical protein [Clostridia bacterium]